MPTIDDAVEAYFAERSIELSDSSLRNHHYQLKQFRQWAGGAGGLDDLDDIAPIDLSRFRRYRSEDLNSNTMYNQLCVLRLFLRFCHRMGWCDEALPESIVLPTRAGRSRDTSIDPDRVGAILDDLERYEYASLDHVLLSLLWTCSLRIGGVRAIDIKDLHLDDRWVKLVHRPSEGTPLKNKDGSEREVNLHGWVCDVLRAWIDDRRPDCTDDYSRTPLLTAGEGRLSRTSVRRHVYSLTACGGLSEPCECSADRYSQCSDSVAPHDIRRSSISAWLDRGTEPALLSGRVDTSTDTMEKHYDVRSETQKRELRRDAFDM
ncbi:integrase [Halorubrum persicum]|uniref:Integrase n=1 Tax=Halorubrum persicum TaxID=1383844 RepID=A0A2G1WFA8_9EURY|nr:integrase [Halorubrum persicum]